jgi:hypothetical protein
MAPAHLPTGSTRLPVRPEYFWRPLMVIAEIK